jgi:methylamine--corrinoid protein Co-methyltransferase
VWKAGVELLVDVGVLCTDTEKVIKFTEQEVLDTIRFAPREVVLGEGKDAVVLAHRDIEDDRLPVLGGGPLGCPMSEDISLKVYEAYAREPSMDAALAGTLAEIGGMAVKSGSPLEMYAEQVTLAWQREAFRRAGRPGMPIFGSMAVSARAAMGACNEEWGYRKGDSLHSYIDINMKTNYEHMSRSEHRHHYGCHGFGLGTSCIGGSFGGVEGAAIGAVAESLATYMVYRAGIVCPYTPDFAHPPMVSASKPLWGTTLADAAVARHTNLIVTQGAPGAIYAGPCTEMYLYEIAASALAMVVCGTNVTNACGRHGTTTDCFGGPLDIRFTRDVAYAATKLDREEANEIVKAILARYEDEIEAQNPPPGKLFQECNDLNSLRPTKEYLDLYDKVKKELEGLGLEFE